MKAFDHNIWFNDKEGRCSLRRRTLWLGWDCSVTSVTLIDETKTDLESQHTKIQIYRVHWIDWCCWSAQKSNRVGDQYFWCLGGLWIICLHATHSYQRKYLFLISSCHWLNKSNTFPNFSKYKNGIPTLIHLIHFRSSSGGIGCSLWK